jgi:formylglycine-generating enzyme required for sulfatase activity
MKLLIKFSLVCAMLFFIICASAEKCIHNSESELIAVMTGSQHQIGFDKGLDSRNVFRDTRLNGFPCPECPEMVMIPAGIFFMGSQTGKGKADEEPLHEVTISRFAMGTHEVMFNEWQACVDDGGCNGYRPSDGGWGRGRRPVINVSWRNARAYVAWLSRHTGQRYRLPSEAEWEYAARAGTATLYPWGNEITLNNANYGRNVGKTTEVGSYSANPFGLYDMQGNVWEWVEDVWHDNYTDAPKDGSAWTTGGDVQRRSLRGGSWSNIPWFVRSAFRAFIYPDDRYNLNNNGFRVARCF